MMVRLLTQMAKAFGCEMEQPDGHPLLFMEEDPLPIFSQGFWDFVHETPMTMWKRSLFALKKHDEKDGRMLSDYDGKKDCFVFDEYPGVYFGLLEILTSSVRPSLTLNVKILKKGDTCPSSNYIMHARKVMIPDGYTFYRLTLEGVRRVSQVFLGEGPETFPYAEIFPDQFRQEFFSDRL